MSLNLSERFMELLRADPKFVALPCQLLALPLKFKKASALFFSTGESMGFKR